MAVRTPHLHGFDTHALCVLYILGTQGFVSRDRLHSLGIVNAPMAIKDAVAKGHALGGNFEVRCTEPDEMTNDVVWTVSSGYVPEMPLPMGMFDASTFDHNSRAYVEKLSAYECKHCGRHPRFLPVREVDGVLRGYCPEHGLSPYLMVSKDGPRPLPKDRSKFDFDLRRSQVQEDSLAAILLGNNQYKIELKHDLQAHQTGRVFIETGRLNYDTGIREKSGLSITEADVYIQSLANRADIYILDVGKLRAYAASSSEVMGGDGRRSFGILIPLPILAQLQPENLWK